MLTHPIAVPIPPYWSSIRDNETFLQSVREVVNNHLAVHDIHPLMCALERLQKLRETALAEKLLAKISDETSSFQLKRLDHVAALIGRYPDCLIFLDALLKHFGPLEQLTFDVFERVAKERPAIVSLLDYPFTQEERTIRLSDLVTDGWALAHIIEARPVLAEHLLFVENKLVLIQNGSWVASIIKARPDLAERLLFVENKPVLIQNGSWVASIIKARPNLAERLLFVENKLVLIQGGLEIVSIIEARPDLAERLLFGPYNKLVLVTNGNLLNAIIKARPDLAEQLLFEPYHKLGLSTEKYCLENIFLVRPDLAERLLFTGNKLDSINNAYLLAYIIEARPDLAEHLLFGENNKVCLITDDTPLRDIIRARPDLAEQLLFEPYNKLGLISGGGTLALIIKAGPDLAERLLFVENKLALISENPDECDGHWLVSIIQSRPNLAEQLLFDENKLALITGDVRVHWLVRIIEVCPDLAERLLFTENKLSMIWHSVWFARILIARPDLAGQLLFDETTGALNQERFNLLLKAQSYLLATLLAASPSLIEHFKPYLFLFQKADEVARVLHASLSFDEEQPHPDDHGPLPHIAFLDRMWSRDFTFSPADLQSFVHTLEAIGTPNAYFLAAYALLGNIRDIEQPDYVTTDSDADEYNEKRTLDAMAFLHKALTTPGLSKAYQQEACRSLYDFAPSKYFPSPERVKAYFKQHNLADLLSSTKLSFFRLELSEEASGTIPMPRPVSSPQVR